MLNSGSTKEQFVVMTSITPNSTPNSTPRSSPTQDKNENTLEELKSHGRNVRSVHSWWGMTRLVLMIFKFFLMDIPQTTLFASLAFTITLEKVYKEYLGPQIQLMKWTEERQAEETTYYHRYCDETDISTHNVEDLIIGPDSTVEECVDHMMIHGMSLYQDILKEETANSLRSYILKRNSEVDNRDSIYVLENDFRWSFGIDANEDPIISKALHEISTNSQFRPAIEAITGPDPALIEFTAITSAYGAVSQDWHADVVFGGSALKYSRSFVPSYSLFITLQNTTSSMGATQICPGTYLCVDEELRFCEANGFQISGDNDVWKVGSGILMNQQSFHSGAAHTDIDGPDRVLFILTFAPKPRKRGETRQLSQGGSYSTRWNMWGHTLKDLENASITMSQPWATLRSLGLYKPRNAEWGWDFVSTTSMRIANEDTGYSNSDLYYYTHEGGGLGLPPFLSVEINYDSTWESFIEETILLWKDVSMQANFFGVTIYIVATTIFSLILMMIIRLDPNTKNKQQTFFDILGKMVFHLIVIHVGIVLVCLSILKYISITDWAREIKSKTLFSSPFLPDSVQSPKRMSTLPSRKDILIGRRFDSPYLASYNKITSYHKGNMIWKSVISEASMTFSIPFADKTQIVHNIVVEMFNNGSRFLMQNSIGDWTILSKVESECLTRKALSLYGNYLPIILETQASFLLSEAKYGYLKSSIMAKYFTPSLVHDIMLKILVANGSFPLNLEKFHSFDQESCRETIHKSRAAKANLFKIESKAVINRTTGSQPSLRSLNDSLNYHDPIIKEGDTVDARYQGDENSGWFRGTVTRISSHGLVDVEYDDGDIDTNLHLNSIRIFTDFEVYENVICWKESENDSYWQNCEIVEIIQKNLYGVLFDDGEYARLTSEEIQRDYDKPDDEETIFCKYQGEGDYQICEIMDENIDGTLNMRYDDGTIEYNVDPDNCMLVES
mmetsp:Transcript_491/g.788  ORF Transcript_491/g.788 Transcript_491/m.788 type:complete len:957 (+) Transcript_491:197-3067(+)|eukprot:CAMPEP_0184860132 /NCGR_PEP_ID=MMETSP0580-20130426/5083_1 /TAXON_ID=1118495 /ORGANISM="Dactyliosolen fragilissimus" /LENGTH=956 /DNA_ID=CAMNT_0027357127 /DNA_START=137 /DNA_END=3007 /DNA_ORIENTATION=+